MLKFLSKLRVPATFVCGLALIPSCIYAQGGPSAVSFAVATHNGVVYVAGEVVGPLPGQTFYGSSDAFVRAYDPSGNELWTRQFGGKGGERSASVAADDTGIYIAGFTDGALPGFTNLGAFDAFVVKFDLNGNQLWLDQFGTSTNDHGTAIALDSTGVYVGGDTSGTLAGQVSAGKDDFFVRKYALTGGLQWTTQFGSRGDDHAYGITVAPSGVYLAGRTSGTFPGQTYAGSIDAVLSKLNTSGVVQWNDEYGTAADDRGWAVAADATYIYEAGRSGAALPGQTYAGGMDDAFYATFSSDSTRLSIVEFGTQAYDRATGIAVDSSGIYIGGVTAGNLGGKSSGVEDSFLRKYQSGVVVWTGQFGTSGDDTAYGVATDTTGIYIVGTTTGTLPGQTEPSGAYIVKYDQNGNMLWTQEFGPV